MFGHFLATGAKSVGYFDLPSMKRLSEAMAGACPNNEDYNPAGAEQYANVVDADSMHNFDPVEMGQADPFPFFELYKFAEIQEGDSLDIIFEDEDSKININSLVLKRSGRENYMYKKLMEAFLSLGFMNMPEEIRETEVELGGYSNEQFGPKHIAQAMTDWVDMDGNAEGATAEDRYYDYGYMAKNNPLETIHELRFVKGIAEFGIMEQFGPFFTIYTDGKININRAQIPVIMAMLLASFPEEELNMERYEMVRKIADAIDKRRKKDGILKFLAQMMECENDPDDQTEPWEEGRFEDTGGRKAPKFDKRGRVIKSKQNQNDTKSLRGFLVAYRNSEKFDYAPEDFPDKVINTFCSTFAKVTSNTFKLKSIARIGEGVATLTKVVQKTPEGLNTLYFRVEPEI